METISVDEWIRLLKAVFPRLPQDRRLAFLIDIPNQPQDDSPDWKLRRELVFDWHKQLRPFQGDLGLQVSLFAYASVDSNNADLPRITFPVIDSLPELSTHLTGYSQSFDDLFQTIQLFVAPTQFSTTAPLKNAAGKYGFRAATMPGFSPLMIPALRIDYNRVNERCVLLKSKLDEATGAQVKFATARQTFDMFFDLSHRAAHVSSGRFPEAGTAGNLPSGETYIVPYEGELTEPSRTTGQLPVQFGEENVVYDVRNNRAVVVVSSGRESEKQAEMLNREPAYGNMAELGFGVLADFGIEAIGEILLDEKLGFHVAFGRSDHFGGATGPASFSSAKSVVHIDRIYVPQLQDRIRLVSIDLLYQGYTERIIENDGYVIF
jgi:hypothetical protein